MSFITASYDYSGSYISGTLELYSESDASTFISASSTYVYSGSALTGTIENYSSGSAYTTKYAPTTYRYNGALSVINYVKEQTVGPSSHPGKRNAL
jgi:hypothetical protein